MSFYDADMDDAWGALLKFHIDLSDLAIRYLYTPNDRDSTVVISSDDRQVRGMLSKSRLVLGDG